MTIALSDARGLRTLLLITRGDYRLAWDLAQTFATYEELASAPRSFIAARFGAAGVRLHLLPIPPSPPPLLSGIWAITRLDHRYPRGIVEALGEAAPPVLYGAGSLSAIRDPVAIGGPLYADGAGVARARALASRITTAAQSVSAAADYHGIGRAGLEGALGSPGSPPVAWLGSSIALGSQAGLLAQIVAAGGAVLTVCPPDEGLSDARLTEAAALAVYASTAAVLIEGGPALEFGRTSARAALAADKPLHVVLGDDIDAGDPLGIELRRLVDPHRGRELDGSWRLGPGASSLLLSGGALARSIAA